MKILNTIARYLVGGLFIFSGLIKVNDPVGTQIKLEEYFSVFAVDIAPFFESLKPISLFLSMLLSTLEVVLGIALIFKYREKLVTTLLLVIIVFFTFLTFYSAYFNKVTDCGCFGDAIKLTPWESFIKDIVLLVFIVVLYINRKTNEFKDSLKKTIVVATTLVFCLVVEVWSINHLPSIDFRAFKNGTSIPTDMQPPYDDPGQVPKITNYGIWGDEDDYTQKSLTGKKLLVIVHETETTNEDAYQMINSLISALGNEVEVVAVTASSGEQFETLRHNVQLAIPYYYSDMTLLKTMVRSNPGLILLNEGEVVNKWHYNDVPGATELLSNLR